MSKQSCSSVLADKHSIYVLCNKCIKWIDAERERLKDIAIKDLISQGKFNLWGLIKRKPYTYEEAKAELEAGDWQTEYFWIDLKYDADEKTFIRLINAMDISSPDSLVITLSTKDAQLLEVYRSDM